MEFGEKLHNIRISKNLSQEELAEKTGISRRSIQNYESGKMLPKKRETYAVLAEALGVEESVLLNRDIDFVLRANEQYGSTAMRQAMDLVAETWTKSCGPCRKPTMRQSRGIMDNRAAELSSKLVRTYGIRDPFRLCQLLDITVKYISTKRQKGLSALIDDIPFIFINRNMSEEMQRMTCAHELGHILPGSPFRTETPARI